MKSNGKMIREFIDRVFNGSVEPLLIHLVRPHYILAGDLKRAFARVAEETKRAA